MGVVWLLFLLLCLMNLVIGQVPINNCTFTEYVPPNETRSITYPRFSRRSSCFWYLYSDPGYGIHANCFQVNYGQLNQDCLSFYGSDGNKNNCAPFAYNSYTHKLLLRALPGSFTCDVRSFKIDDNCRCGLSKAPFIVGGTVAEVNEFPMMVSLVDIRKRAHACGATIISSMYVVTAAHCLMVLVPSKTGVLVGEHDLETNLDTSVTTMYRVRRFVYHPQWSSSLTKNDIGLIQVDRPMDFRNMAVGPACLPFNWPYTPRLNEELTVTGWGTISYGGPVAMILRKVKLRVVHIGRCQKVYGNKVSSDGQFCTYEPGKDSCQMDSGGPLLSIQNQRYFLAGIVSYGGICAGDDPSVSTWVYPYVDWIRRVTGDNFCIK